MPKFQTCLGLSEVIGQRRSGNTFYRAISVGLFTPESNVQGRPQTSVDVPMRLHVECGRVCSGCAISSTFPPICTVNAVCACASTRIFQLIAMRAICLVQGRPFPSVDIHGYRK
ncbi:hypothetical protein J6590_028641 [Homalodisca vitripennis]|nr:hypothetical protein J6590_028641 [Homalodisca vitripennis]